MIARRLLVGKCGKLFFVSPAVVATYLRSNTLIPANSAIKHGLDVGNITRLTWVAPQTNENVPGIVPRVECSDITNDQLGISDETGHGGTNLYIY